MVRKDPGSGHEDVRSGLGDDRRRVDLDAAVDLEFHVQVLLVQVRARLADLRDDVLDSFIVEDEQGEMMNVLLEDVRSIDEWVELSVAGDSLYEKG